MPSLKINVWHLPAISRKEKINEQESLLVRAISGCCADPVQLRGQRNERCQGDGFPW
jgi:hypothetical protein